MERPNVKDYTHRIYEDLTKYIKYLERNLKIKIALAKIQLAGQKCHAVIFAGSRWRRNNDYKHFNKTNTNRHCTRNRKDSTTCKD